LEEGGRRVGGRRLEVGGRRLEEGGRRKGEGGRRKGYRRSASAWAVSGGWDVGRTIRRSFKAPGGGCCIRARAVP
jgi:hypothetical protein